MFGVSPGLTPELVAAARDSALPLLPGVMTPSDVIAARAAGFTELKLFPAQQAGGIGMLKALAGPFPDVTFCPTGGISAATAPDFLALPNVACVGGSWLTPRRRGRRSRLGPHHRAGTRHRASRPGRLNPIDDCAHPATPTKDSSMPQVNSFDLLLFGGTGDLAMRKLLPALYFRHRDGDLPPHGRILGLAREQLGRFDFIAKVKSSFASFVPAADMDEAAFATFAERLDYAKVEANTPEDFDALAQVLKDSPAEVRVFFLSTAPDFFAPICKNLAAAGLATPTRASCWRSRSGATWPRRRRSTSDVGARLQRAADLSHRSLSRQGAGAEPARAALRQCPVRAAVATATWVRNVQITDRRAASASRPAASSTTSTGALRDMVQNHLLQLLCIMAMEPPASIDPDAVRDEKLKVLRALTPDHAAPTSARRTRCAASIARAPSTASRCRATSRKPACRPTARTETFVALKAEIENWRWSGVPFYLRTGKRLPERVGRDRRQFPLGAAFDLSVAAALHAAPTASSSSCSRTRASSSIMIAKSPGERHEPAAGRPEPRLRRQFKQRPMEAYERLLLDVDPRQPDAVHAPRRAGRRLALDRADPERLARLGRGAPALQRRIVGTCRFQRAGRA